MGDFPVPVQFRNGQHLTSALFRTEQKFHRTLLERHAITAHEWGIADGLELSAEAVEPGLAYDGFGRPLVLGTRSVFNAAAFFDLYDVVELDVSLVYSYTSDPTSDVLVERPDVQLSPATAGADRRAAPQTAHYFDASSRAPHDLKHPWPVYLGTLSRDPTAADKPIAANTDGRPYIGVRASRIVHPDNTYELDLDSGVSVRATSSTGSASAPLTPILTWTGPPDKAVVATSGRLVVGGELTARGIELTRNAPATTNVPTEWSLQRVLDGAVEELRLVFGEDSAAGPQSRFVVGAMVDGTFKEFLIVQLDGTVTVDGNLVVTGDLTVSGQVKP
jgi:hypothetical protein